jgi:hypothetical protein
MDERYIPGIYNYCDSWCERCRFTDRCLNFSMGEERRERRLAQGEDPDNWDAVIEDVGDSFAEALAMLHEMAEEQGIDLDDLPPAPPEPDTDDHPLQVLAWDLRHRAMPFLERLEQAVEAEHAALESRADGPPEEDEIALARLENSCEIIRWYHTLLPPKVHRALQGQACGEMEEGPGWEFRFDDARGTAKLIHECCEKLMGALAHVRTAVPSLDEEAQVLLHMANSLREGIVVAVPHCLQYHRPGMDDGA